MPQTTDYRLVRRTKHARANKPLSGYAFDLTIRVNADEAYFLDDLNNPGNVMPHNNREEMVQTLLDELERHHEEHFGHK